MRKFIFIIGIIWLLPACNLTNDILDQKPQASVASEDAIVNPETAENALTGVYARLQSGDTYGRMFPVYGALLSGYNGSTANTTRQITFQAEQNSVSPGDATLGNSWSSFYAAINAANNVIKGVGDLDEGLFEPGRKTEIIAEARLLRGMLHFDVLRYWGQFWDVNSALGIIIRDEPGKLENAVKGRSSVLAVYDFVLSDLDFAVTNAPDFSINTLASKELAKALKARVLLYKGDYAEAVTAADDAITSAGAAGIKLEPQGKYLDIFNKGLASSELVFSPFFSQAQSNNHAVFHFPKDLGGRYDYGITKQYEDSLSGDNRGEGASFKVNNNNEAYVAKYSRINNGDDPAYLFRLAELYLIRAEAIARSSEDKLLIKADIDEIRDRAVEGPTKADTIEELLVEIQKEKVKELAFEGGHEWFDAIRFGNIAEIKNIVTSTNQWVLPLPTAEIQSNNKAVQNPGY